MKTNKTKLAVILCMALVQLAPNFASANEGNSSGGGTGDNAFLMQQTFDANPELTPSEVLEKIFEESSGRLPQLVEINNGYCSASANSCYSFKEAVVGHLLKINSYAITKGKEEYNLLSAEQLTLSFYIQDRGPLFEKTSSYVPISGGNGRPAIFATTGVKFENAYYIKEFRVYRPGILIYKIIGKNAQCSSKDKFISGQFTTCTNGYVWSN